MSQAVKTETSLNRAEPVLSVNGLRKEFRGRTVLHDFSLDVHPGETICIIGPSGSGKSTMLRCLNGLETPSGGEVRVESVIVPRTGRELDRLRTRVGMVFQQFNLFPHMSVRSNVMFGLTHSKCLKKDEASRIAMERLDDVGLAHLADKSPQSLSGGERQRVAIARALAMEPAVILFDEPTSSLDPELVKSVLGLMRELSRNDVTMLVVTHEMGFARGVADRVLFMDQGAVVECGPPAEIFDNPQSERLKKFLSQVL
jgi:ABC-type polar amino acid transport system ATPase subunit